MGNAVLFTRQKTFSYYQRILIIRTIGFFVVIGSSIPVFGQTIRSTFYDGGVNAYVRYAHEARFDSSVVMTIEAWIKPSAPFGLNPTIVSHNNVSSYWFGLQQVTTTTARLRFYRSGGLGASSTGVIGVGRWSHVAAVYNGSVVNFYIDGNFSNSVVLSNSGSGFNSPLYIGGHEGGCCADPAGFSFHGMIDEVRIWSNSQSLLQIRNNMYEQVRGALGLVAAWGTGGRHEDEGDVTGTDGGDTTENIEGMVPHELVVPLAALPGNMVVDGDVDRAFEYVGGEQMVVRYGAGSNATVGLANVHLVHTDTDLYIGIRTISSPIGGWDPYQSFVGFMFDPDYSRDSLAQSTDFRITSNLGSQNRRWEVGNGVGGFDLLFPFPPGDPIDHAVSSCGEFGEVCIEIRIAKTLMGEWTDTDGFSIGHLDLSASLDDHLAPGGAIWNAPNTWGTLQYDESSPILPRAKIVGTIPGMPLTDKCVGGTNDRRACTDNADCPDGVCTLIGQTVWLMSPLRDEPLYSTTTDAIGNFAFRENTWGLLVPPNTTLTVQTEGCLGCRYPDAIVDEAQIVSTGIRPLAVHGLSVTFPSPCDACTGSCSVGNSCTYPHVTFMIRQPPPPTTVTSIVPDTLHKEIVLRDTPRKTIPPTRLRIRGENFHEFLDVYLDGHCTSFPNGCDRVPMDIVDRGTDKTGDWLDVELLGDYPSSGVRNITIRDRWVWGRTSGILRGWIHAGEVGWDGGGEYPQLWGLEFINEASEGAWDDFSTVFGNNAYICLGLPEIDGVCLGCRVPRPYYLLYFIAYKIAVDNIAGNCVGMAATSLLFRHGDLNSESFTAGAHFPTGLPGRTDVDDHTHHIHAPQPGRWGFEACAPWNRENIWAHVRTNHGVQMSAEFMHETFNDFTGGAFSTDGNPIRVLSDSAPSLPNQVISTAPSLGTGHAIVPYGTEVVGTRCDGGCNDLAECTSDADCLRCDDRCTLFAVDRCPADTIGDCVDGACAGGCNDGGACTSEADCPDCDDECDKSHVNECGDPNVLIGRCRRFSKIKVYDNNWPENNGRSILIDTDRNRYRFELSTRRVWRGNGIYSIPISVWQNGRTAPGLMELADFLVSFTFGSADALYSDSGGGEWGWRADGTVVDALPGAVASVPLQKGHDIGPITFTESRNVVLLLPASGDMPTVDLHGRGGDCQSRGCDFGFHSALGGTSVQLQGFNSHEGDENRIQLFRDGDRIGGMDFTPFQNGTRFISKLGAQPSPNESTVFHFLGLHIEGGQSVRFDMFPEEFGVGMDNDGTTPLSYYLIVESVDGLAEEHSRNLFGPFSVPAGARHRATIDDWPVAGFLRSEIDLDRDGIPEQFVTVGARSCGGLEGGPPRDLNHNGIPDECESGGDANGDSLTDLQDYRKLWKCLKGPNVAYPEPSCSAVDLDFDGDVDLRDVSLFEGMYSPSQQQPHFCCQVGPAGCDDPVVEACVCENDPFCCEKEWDEQCIWEVDGFACGDCGTSDHKCCESGGPGCDDPAIATCVCAEDPYCCETEWDNSCVREVQSTLCGICDGFPDCCSPTGVGCGHPLIEECVCAEDDYCCMDEWDQRCVDLVDLLGCGTCTPHDCCITGGPGCADSAVEACVCAGDPACCSNQWDRLCIEEISIFDCGTCGDHSCCDIGTPGCADAEVLACVCSQDPFCCTEEWDQRCIDEVNDLACGSCASDTCSGAESVDLPANIIGDTSTSLFYDAPVCDGVEVTSSGRWYTVVGTGATITASTCNDFVEFDTRISVYEGECASLSCVAANDDNCHISGFSSVSWCSTPDVTYRILLHGAGNETGGFYLTINQGNICNLLDVFVHKADVSNSNGNTTTVDRITTNALPGNLLYITQNWNPGGVGGVYNNAPVGLWYLDPKWRIINEDISDMPLGASFNVAVLPRTDLSYVHIAQGDNLILNYTLLDHSDTNNNPNAIVMVSQYWGFDLFAGVYNDAPIGVWYNDFTSQWSVFNQDGSSMPANAKFNVAIYKTSNTAFVHQATVANSIGNSTTIDQIDTNGNPNAIIMVTQNWNPGNVGGVYNITPIGVWYGSGKWKIFNEDLSTMPIGASFNVVILPTE